MRISDWSSDVCSSDLAGCPVTVYVVPSAPAAKLAAIRSFGAELVFVEGAPLDAELEARRQAKVQGKAYVAPYNDIETMAGQGTLGMELARQAPDLDAVFVCVGGGGLIGGVGAAIKTLSPQTRSEERSARSEWGRPFRVRLRPST